MFNEDLDQYFADFGVQATFGAESGLVIFDAPDVLITEGQVISAEYHLTFKASQFAGLAYQSTITIAGDDYRVNWVQTTEDGNLKMAALSKL